MCQSRPKMTKNDMLAITAVLSSVTPTGREETSHMQGKHAEPYKHY